MIEYLRSIYFKVLNKKMYIEIINTLEENGFRQHEFMPSQYIKDIILRKVNVTLFLDIGLDNFRIHISKNNKKSIKSWILIIEHKTIAEFFFENKIINKSSWTQEKKETQKYIKNLKQEHIIEYIKRLMFKINKIAHMAIYGKSTCTEREFYLLPRRGNNGLILFDMFNIRGEIDCMIMKDE